MLVSLKNYLFTTLLAMAGLLAALSAPPAWAVPANPEPRIVTQPDGTTLTLRLRGDEFQNWTELDDTGYTVVRNPDTRYLEYAEQAGDGSLRGSGVRAEPGARNAPTFLPKRVKPSRNTEHERHQREMLRDTYQQRLSQARATPSAPPAGAEAVAAPWDPAPVSGEKKLLIILINYANRTFLTSAQSWYDKIFDETAKSVAKYYRENSYNAIAVTPVPHTQPGSPAGVISVTLSDNHPNYGGTYTFAVDQAIGNHALQQAAPYVDFNSYDTNGDGKLDTSEVVIYFIHAGYETAASSGLSPSVWAHAWWTSGTGLTAGSKNVQRWGLNGEMYSSTSAMGLGVVAHELGHQFCGLPDLYDTSDTNAGLGLFSLMASGSWGATTGELGGYTPTGLDAWSREFLGWAAPATPVIGQLGFVPPLASATGVYKLAIPAVSTTEYFLAENRYPSGWDLGLKGYFGSGWAGGLLVLHIDNTIGSPVNNDINTYVAGSHQGVVPVQANTSTCNMLTTTCDGKANTLFYAGNNSAWSNATTPNSRYYSGVSTNFSLTGVSAAANPMTAVFSDGVAPTVLSATPVSGATGVAAATAVTALFSQPMTAATINASTFTLSGGVTGIVTYDPATRTATLTPSAALAPGTSYTATITTAVTNTAGIALTTARSWSFTTLAPLTIGTANPLPNGTVGSPYSTSASASGGVAPYTWSITGGGLAPGLSLATSTGFISGTPTSAGVFSVSLLVSDSSGSSVGKSFSQAVSTVACANWPVRAGTATPALFPDFSSAYQASADNDLFQLQALDFNTDFLFDRNIGVTMRGGYDCGYTTNASTTGILGSLRVRSGTVKIDNVKLK